MTVIRMKLLLVKTAIFLTLLSLGAATSYFSRDYSLSKAFQLGVLSALATLAVTAILFYLLSLLLTPLLAGREREEEETPSPPRQKYHPQTKEKRIVHHSSREAFAAENGGGSDRINETRQLLQEMEQQQGAVDEVLLILPLDLSFLLAKESIESLFLGKIEQEDQETGTILGRAGLGRNPQEIKITLQATTSRSTSLTISSRSPLKKQYEKKNLSYLKKISAFLRKKEKLYIE